MLIAQPLPQSEETCKQLVFGALLCSASCLRFAALLQDLDATHTTKLAQWLLSLAVKLHKDRHVHCLPSVSLSLQQRCCCVLFHGHNSLASTAGQCMYLCLMSWGSTEGQQTKF